MDDLTGADRKRLKSLAHHLKPIVQTGKQGITDTVVQAVDEALEAHELIKVKFGDLKDKKKELAAELEARTGAHVVGMIGNILTLYRQHRDETKRIIEL